MPGSLMAGGTLPCVKGWGPCPWSWGWRGCALGSWGSSHGGQAELPGIWRREDHAAPLGCRSLGQGGPGLECGSCLLLLSRGGIGGPRLPSWGLGDPGPPSLGLFLDSAWALQQLDPWSSPRQSPRQAGRYREPRRPGRPSSVWQGYRSSQPVNSHFPVLFRSGGRGRPVADLPSPQGNVSTYDRDINRKSCHAASLAL